MTEELKQAAQMALEALTCTGEDDDPGHRCGHCDDYVDRNGHVRSALRAAISQAQGGTDDSEPVGHVFTMEALGTPGRPFYHVQLSRPLPTGTKLYTHPAPGVSEDVVRDAERYRVVRRGQHWSVVNGIGDTLRGEALDAAVDAIAAAQAKGGE